MLRVRIDGGALTATQLAELGAVTSEFARNVADLTNRQNIQLHGIELAHVPRIWERLEAVGLTTLESGGDTPRVILGSPLAGVAADEIVDGTPAIQEIRRRVLGNPAFDNLPRKYKTAISGSPRLDVAPESQCVSFVGVRHPRHGPGFDVWVGGGLSTRAFFAQRLGAWVAADDVPDVWMAITAAFRDYGYRRVRAKARLKYLIADWGPRRFRGVIESEYLGRRLLDGPPPSAPLDGHRDHVGVHPQRDGAYYVGTCPTAGRVSGAALTNAAAAARAAGSNRIRLTPEQHLIVLDVPKSRTAALVNTLADLDLRASASAFRRGVQVCTGIEFCKLAIVETKARATTTIRDLERRMPDLDVPIRISVNGCPYACARFQTADIGLCGWLVPGADGEMIEGFKVAVGGSPAPEPRVARTLVGGRTAAGDLAACVERIVRNYLGTRNGMESFADWAHRALESDLR